MYFAEIIKRSSINPMAIVKQINIDNSLDVIATVIKGVQSDAERKYLLAFKKCIILYQDLVQKRGFIRPEFFYGDLYRNEYCDDELNYLELVFDYICVIFEGTNKFTQVLLEEYFEITEIFRCFKSDFEPLHEFAQYLINIEQKRDKKQLSELRETAELVRDQMKINQTKMGANIAAEEPKNKTKQTKKTRKKTTTKKKAGK